MCKNFVGEWFDFMIILGIDPGIAIVGYGIIEYKNNPLCSFKFDNCSNRCLFTLDKNLKKKSF